MELSHVLGFDSEVHLFLHLDAELADRVGKRANVVVREEDIQPIEQPERNVEVKRHHVLDTRAKDFDGDVFTINPRAVDLTKARRSHGLAIEILEQLVDGLSEFGLNDLDDVGTVGRGNLVL